MTLTPGTIDEAAAQLFAADADSAPIGQLTQRYPGMEVADAYAIQQVNLARRLAAVAPWSATRSADLRADADPARRRPTRFRLHPRHHGDRERGGRAAVPVLFAPVEPEVAFLLREPLRGPGVGIEQVRAATEAVAVALEIVDSRIADWKLTLPDTVADNASSGAVVLGDWVPYTEAIDLAGARASLRLNGTEIDTGFGSAVLGDPAAAVAWLANALVPFGTEIVAGQFIMSGSFTTAAFVQAGDAASATIDGLGTVSLTFT